MSGVKIKNKNILILIFSLLIGCKENKNQPVKKQEEKKPLVFSINFSSFGKYEFDNDAKTWKNHKNDSVVYFKINFENLKKEPIILKTGLIATKIPFVLKYSKGLEDNVILEVFQQFNTIYSDSIILKQEKVADFPVVDQAFRIGYYHNGVDEVCQLKVNQHHDTINISNQKIKNCIERKNKPR